MNSIKHVSDTALWVAHHRGVEGEKPGALFRDPLAAKLAGERGRKIAAEMPYGGILGWIMAVRTVVIDRLILDCIADGVDTIVNIGAGLDTRPYRMQLPPNLRWIELDFQDLIEYKNEQLKDEIACCKLERHGLDFSNRKAAQQLYRSIGISSKRVLLLTEGVVIYLSPLQAAELAEDLAATPNFEFWIQDYRDSSGSAWRTPPGYRKKMKSAPFKFLVPDSAEFFSKYHWKVEKRLLSMDEGLKIGRPFPLGFPWNILMKFITKKKLQHMARASGYFLLKKSSDLS